MAKTPTNQILLLRAVTTPTTGAGFDLSPYTYDNDERNFVAYVAGTGAVSATVLVEVSNNNLHWITLGTITLSGTTEAADGFVSDESWPWVRAQLTAVSGTDAAVTVTMGA
jgi:hypothetical protein